MMQRISAGVALFTLFIALKNLHQVLNIFLEKTPEGIDLHKIKHELLKIKEVSDVHHIHVRSIDGYNNYATLHVVVSKYSHELKEQIKHKLRHLGINHSTIELELKGERCNEEKCEIITQNHSHAHSH